MNTRLNRRANLEALKRRREEVANLLLEDYTVREIVEFSVYSETTIRRDIEYIKSHPDEFVF